MSTADQSTVSNGLLRVKAKGRLLFVAKGQRTDESRLDAVINAVGEVDLPPPSVEQRPVATPGGPPGPTAEIERLARLHAEDVLTDEEFSAAKGKVLGVQKTTES